MFQMNALYDRYIMLYDNEQYSAYAHAMLDSVKSLNLSMAVALPVMGQDMSLLQSFRV